MKKFNYTFIIMLLLFALAGCSLQNSKYINFSTKPNNHYYIDEIRNKILSNEKFDLFVFDTNLYKEIQVPKDETSVVENFLSALTEENYSDESVTTKEPYRLKIIFDDKNQYLIRIYNNSVISVSPWDGIYKEDIVLTKNTPLRYNLFDFCNHISNKPLSK